MNCRGAEAVYAMLLLKGKGSGNREVREAGWGAVGVVAGVEKKRI
ncbi:MAG TPA: hypothetical protein VG738_19300 [Chitinophagaceae bacterium]|nr:hypothetical protein [Chitinophagaceae bacterium]